MITPHQPNRREMLRLATIAGCAVSLAPNLLADEKTPRDRDAADRFSIGIQEYTFHRWINSGKLTHLDYPALAKKEFGINHIEYWNRPFNGKHTDKKFVGELAKRTTGEGMKNVLILVDASNDLDSPDTEKQDKSIKEHAEWIECAAQLGCDAIRVNCRVGGDRNDNLRNAANGINRLCKATEDFDVKVVVEPHGGNSQDPDWLLELMKKADHPRAGLLPDFNNFGGNDRYECVTKTIPHAVALCAKALEFDDKGNETRTDFYRMMKIVYESNYSGVISIEFEGHGVDPVEGVKTTKTLIEKALAAAKA